MAEMKTYPITIWYGVPQDFIRHADGTLAVKDGLRVMQYDKTSGVWVELASADGHFSMTLAAGDGELIRIV